MEKNRGNEKRSRKQRQNRGKQIVEKSLEG